MLKAVFYRRGDALCGFTVSGHAGYGVEGTDIVCASVSSAVMLVCNTITDFFGADADVSVEENRITLRLKEKNDAAEKLLASFFAHMGFIAEEHSNIKLETHKTGGKNDD